MARNNAISKNKSIMVVLSFLLVVVLAACIFGMEYSSATKEAESKIASQNSLIEAVETERDKLAKQNTENKAQIASQEQQINDLNSKIQQLESENAYIKATKGQTASTKPVTPPKNIDLSLLTKPNEGDKVCYLTFDDGPSENTLKILDILKRANAKASFFVVGTSNLDYIKRAHNEGHTIGLHANSHDYAKLYKSEDAFFGDMSKLSAKIEKLIGVTTKIMRFPGGSSNTISKKYNRGIMTRLTKKVEQKGYVYVDWNVDSNDATGNNVPKSKILNSIKRETSGRGDICVLMHDTGAKDTTVDALPEMICYLRAMGYRFEALTTESTVFHHGVNN